MFNNHLFSVSPWFRKKKISHITTDIYSDEDFSFFYNEIANNTEIHSDISFFIQELKGSSVLEIGSGNGRIACPLIDAEINYIGIEPEYQMIKFLDKKYRNKIYHIDLNSFLKLSNVKDILDDIDTIIIPATSISLFSPDEITDFLFRIRQFSKKFKRVIFDYNSPNFFDNELHFNNTKHGKFYYANYIDSTFVYYNVYYNEKLGVSKKYLYNEYIVQNIAEKVNMRYENLYQEKDYKMVTIRV